MALGTRMSVSFYYRHQSSEIWRGKSRPSWKFLKQNIFYLQFYAQTKYVASSFRRKPCLLDIEIDSGNAEAVHDHQMESKEIANMDAMRGVKRQKKSTSNRDGEKREERRRQENNRRNGGTESSSWIS